MQLQAGSTVLTTLAVLMLLSITVAGCSSADEERGSSQSTSSLEAQDGVLATASIEREYISAEFEEWAARPETLVKHVDAIYIGTVRSADRTFSRLGVPGDVWTAYTVEVEESLLGDVDRKITLIQQGGFDADRNVTVLIDGVPLIEVGETYLFASMTERHVPREDLPDRVAQPTPLADGEHIVVEPTGHIRIEDEAHRRQLIEEYTEAIKQAGLGS